MNRAELEQLDRDALIARAEAAGVTRARILTRPELVDELLLRSAADRASKQRARGLFGRARDLLARVVERGLHLPDAADRIRALGGFVSGGPRAPAALPTVTLAEIYAAQGHRDRAVETLEGVLAREPDHAAAKALLAQMRDATYLVPPPRMAPERDLGQEPRQDPEEIRAPAASAAPNGARMISDSAPAPPATALSEPMHMLDDAPLPTRYDVDECVAIPVDPRTLYVYWEVREQTLAIVRSGTTPAGAIALRVIVIVPTWDGPRSSTRDHDVHSTLGDYFITDLPAGSVVRAAIGLRCGELFVPIAHSPPLETPPGGPSPLVADVLVRWTPKGVLLPISPSDRDAESIARALGHIRRQEARDSARKRTRGNVGEHSLGGSSERWALRPEG